MKKQTLHFDCHFFYWLGPLGVQGQIYYYGCGGAIAWGWGDGGPAVDCELKIPLCQRQ